MTVLASRSARALTAAAVATGAVFVTAPSASAVTKLTHSQATSKFRTYGLTWSSSGGCSDRYTSTCTSFEQINLATADGIVTFKRASGCATNITGGTEVGHASGTYSHWNGYKVDIGITTCNNSYITRNFAYAGVRGDGATLYKSAAGNIYAKEGNHWDITYYNCGGC
ncbi:hypothetical protein BCF74_102194 [Knoellia remsis]|uniref:Peptidase M15-like protein n=1 Tax=Knoellia remsis TaxID=407159 RepID=A0A2T0UZM7_9MICO|nr:hypothetical protein [Knoellia remsis]PRY63361.1 hypothetical protein BCF74_102194 [Knoellia remsis]